jgi:chromosome segregation ATPase
MAKEKSGAAAANGNGHHGVAEAPAGKEDVPEVQDRKAEQLKALNTMLVKEATQRQGEVAALTARLEELSADDAALAATESAVALSAVAAPLRAGADEIAALRARLAAVQESLHAADLRMAVETGARGEADARLEAAAEEIATVLKLLREKEVEVASVSEKVSSMAAMVAEMEGKNAELFGEKSELGKQLEGAKVAAGVLSREKAEVEGRAQEFRNSPEAYNLHLHEKLTAKVNELNVLGAKKAEMDARVEYLVAELSAAVAKKGELEAEVVANKREVDSVRVENDTLRSEIVVAEKQLSVSVAEVESLRVELAALEKAKEAAAKAFDDEKAQLVGELATLKKKVEEIQAEKEAAEGATREKDW